MKQGLNYIVVSRWSAATLPRDSAVLNAGRVVFSIDPFNQTDGVRSCALCAWNDSVRGSAGLPLARAHTRGLWRFGARRLTAFAPKPSAPAKVPERILVTRLERIGDLLMTLARSRRCACGRRTPRSTWWWAAGTSRSRAGCPGLIVQTLDVPWLARQARGMSFAQLLQRARSWRQRRFDLAVNLEPDIRSNLLIWLSGASRRVGFLSGGGGRLLTTALPYRPSEHTASNAQRLVDVALPDSGVRERPIHRRGCQFPMRIAAPPFSCSAGRHHTS